MPILLCRPIRRLSQREFGELAYVVMSHVFQIHDEFGRLFDEAIYKKELACRFPGVERGAHSNYPPVIPNNPLLRRAG